MTTTSEKRLQKLKERLATISDVNAAEATPHWDRQTYMPDDGVAGRAEQVATLSRLTHEMLASEETRRLLRDVDEPAPGSEDSALLRLARREYERATKLRAGLVAELARSTALARPAGWTPPPTCVT